MSRSTQTLNELLREIPVETPVEIILQKLPQKIVLLDEGATKDPQPQGNKMLLQAADLPQATLWYSPPEQVQVNVSRHLGMWSLTCHTFATAFCNIALTSGKWMYEVVLGADGLMQIGWSIPASFVPCDGRFGVGDFPFTFGYDGYRLAMWNVTPTQCGPRWVAGDIVTCLIDIHEHVEVTFLLNGIEVHTEKFSPTGAPRMYVPAITLGNSESCVVNLGCCPMKYPVENFCSLETTVNLTDKWASRLKLIFAAMATEEARHLLPALAAVALAELNSGNESQLCSFCHALYGILIAQKEAGSTYGANISFSSIQKVVSTVLRPNTSLIVFSYVISIASFQHSLRLLSLENPTPSKDLELVADLLSVSSVCSDWSSSSVFFGDLLNVFRLKIPNSDQLKALFPDIPLASDISPEGIAFAKKLENVYARCVAKDDNTRKRIVSLLVSHPPAASFFHEFLDKVVRERMDSSPFVRRNGVFGADGNTAIRLFIALAAVVSERLQMQPSVGAQIAAFCPRRILTASVIAQTDVPRLGGSYQYVARTRSHCIINDGFSQPYDSLLIKAALIFVAGAKPRIMEACDGILARNKLREKLRDAESIAATDMPAAIRRCAWDYVTFFYANDHKIFMEFCSVLAEILDNFYGTPVFPFLPCVIVESFVDLLHSCRRTAQDFASLLSAHPKCVTILFKLYLHSEIQQDTNEYVMAALGILLESYELHRQVVVDILQNEWTPFKNFLHLVLGQFGHRMAWTLVVGTLVRFNSGNYFALSEDEEMLNFSILYPQRERRNVPAAAFKFYLSAFRKLFEEGDSPHSKSAQSVSGRFLQNLVDHTNFAITELGSALNDVQLNTQQCDSSVATHEVAIQRRRCSSLFELARNLLHIVEFTLDAVPDLLFAVEKEPDERRLLFTRMVVQTIGQCLSRFASNSVALARVIQLKLRGLERVQQWRLLAPVVGCLFNMTQGGGSLDPKTNIFLSFFSKPGVEWSIEQLHFALTAFDWASLEAQGPNSVVSKADFTRRADVIECFEKCFAAKTEASKNPILDDSTGDIESGICPICALSPINAEFRPCGHSSCMSCIQRHMLTSKKCFYCNTKVDSVVPISDE